MKIESGKTSQRRDRAHRERLGFVRRTVRIAAAATIPITILAGAKAVDNLATYIHYPPISPGVELLQTNTPANMLDRATVVAPPLGQYDARMDATTLIPSLEKQGRVIALNVGNGDVDSKKNAQLVNQELKKLHIKEANYVGISTGGNEVDEMLPDLDRDVTLGKIIYVGTPITWPTILNPDKWIPAIPNKLHYPVGIAEQFTANMLSDVFGVGQAPIPACGPPQPLDPIARFKVAVQQTLDGEPPGAWEAAYGVDMRSSRQSTARELSTARPKGLVYIGSSNDQIVNDPAAAQELIAAEREATQMQNTELQTHGRISLARSEKLAAAPITEITIQDAEHASVNQHSGAYNAAVEQALAPQMKKTKSKPVKVTINIAKSPQGCSSPNASSPSTIIALPNLRDTDQSSSPAHQNEASDLAASR